MFVHHYGDVVLTPDVEHGAVYDVGEGSLGVIGNGLTKNVWIVSPSKEPSLTSCKANQVACRSESEIDMVLPLLVRRESTEVFGLEGDDDVDRESIGFGEGVWLSSV